MFQLVMSAGGYVEVAVDRAAAVAAAAVVVVAVTVAAAEAVVVEVEVVPVVAGLVGLPSDFGEQAGFVAWLACFEHSSASVGLDWAQLAFAEHEQPAVAVVAAAAVDVVEEQAAEP